MLDEPGKIDRDADMDRAAGTSSESQQSFAEPAQRVPVAYDADVVVVGAGPGGFAAAL
jgi:NADPH-dependent 2,4-dienoyl-CoA reductase/sulfur reductase-like enzyme